MTEQNGLERSSATDKLRRLLDERGVEYRVSATGYSIDIGPSMTAYANRTDTTLDVSLRGLTPEQAVAATLGPGTCREVKIDRYWRGCGECGYVWEFMYGIDKCERPRYCPNCGRRVEP